MSSRNRVGGLKFERKGDKKTTVSTVDEVFGQHSLLTYVSVNYHVYN